MNSTSILGGGGKAGASRQLSVLKDTRFKMMLSVFPHWEESKILWSFFFFERDKQSAFAELWENADQEMNYMCLSEATKQTCLVVVFNIQYNLSVVWWRKGPGNEICRCNVNKRPQFTVNGNSLNLFYEKIVILPHWDFLAYILQEFS